jgi:hypothetical protein
VADQGAEPLPHLWVRDRAESRAFHRTGGGDPKIRDVEYRGHGGARQLEMRDAIDAQDRRRAEQALTDEELRALGVLVVLEGADAAFPLRVESLERMSRHRKQPKRPQWLLLSVMPATDSAPERATVWVSDEYRATFLKLFEDYLERKSTKDNPWNQELIANIGRIRAAVAADLWQSQGTPPTTGTRWWELWLRPTTDGEELLRRYAAATSAQLADRVLRLQDRTVAWMRSSWDGLQALPFSAVPLSEIRDPEFVDTIEDLPREDQDLLSEDLAARLVAAAPGAPAVCHLDTGIMRSHVLLEQSLAEQDMHTVVGTSPLGTGNHGTLMAGLGLYGPLDELLLGAGTVALRHRLESVRILPDSGPGHDPLAYGVVTAQAVALPEATVQRPRVFCMPVTAPPDLPGEPTLWSAAIDALAVGVGVGRSEDGIELLGAPDPAAARLFVISAGNVEGQDFQADYRSACDASVIEDPAHAWNALTVGAHTDLTDAPDHPDYDGWSVIGARGDISPHSRTSLLFAGRAWPVKPDICMEGGNLLTDGASDFVSEHPLLSVRSTDIGHDRALGSAFATSAATAQAARLGAMAMATYPEFWPETIRGLLTHAAEWTPAMRAEIDAPATKALRLRMLRRYGWGVPTEEAVLTSERNAVTMVTQDTFVPFDGPDHLARRFRLHQLPWPQEALADLGPATVTLRVTLSYFVEPTASRRGWRRRYAYASHGLRFDLKSPLETVEEFVSRVNQEAQSEEDGTMRPSGLPERWLIGPQQRTTGSLHQDLWEGSGADLAASGVLAVHPVGGWWKNAKREDRADRAVRYALIVSLKTDEQGIDLYTPVHVQLPLPLPIETAIPAT